MTTPAPPVSHIYVLLDRSGSMQSIADDVVGGFNRFLADQQADGADARMTLVQFDSEDPEEVVADGVPVLEMVPLTAATFVPRGGTPLLDATGRIVARASAHAAALTEGDHPAEDVTIVTITDGQENQSRELSLEQVQAMIATKQALGWTFAFLSAGLDAYGEAGRLGHDARSTQAFAATPAGARAAFDSTSAAVRRKRSKLRSGEAFDAQDLFEGDKPAEDGGA
jgi:Mg-chelatase subunit ChlD